MASKIQWSRASTIAHNWQNSTYKLLAEQDQHGATQYLKSWWVDKATLLDILNSTPNSSGIRLYPVAQDQDLSGNAVPLYHSLVLVGTQPGTRPGDQDNFRPADDMVYDFLQPCPNMCPSKNDL